MEKKNVVFLTVLSIATLLTAVVGTTFAYFTATFTGTNEANGSVTTAAICGMEVNVGEFQDGGVTQILPGWVGYQTVTVNGVNSTAADTCTGGTYTVNLAATHSFTAGYLKYEVYKSTAAADQTALATFLGSAYTAPVDGPKITATGDGANKYEYTTDGSFALPGSGYSFTSLVSATNIASGNNTVATNASYTGTSKDTYVIVYKFLNLNEVQNVDMNKTLDTNVTVAMTGQSIGA